MSSEDLVRHQVVVKLRCTVELPFDKSPKKHIHNILSEALGPKLAFNASIESVEALPRKKTETKKQKLGEFPIEEVLPYVTYEPVHKEYKIDEKTYSVKMNSDRYNVFKNNRKCVCCGLEGTVFFLEKHPNDKNPHFNLYGLNEEGEYILFTKDHICARSRGGGNRYSNYQTMCYTCNNFKGSWNISLENLLKLRQIHKENKPFLSKTKLSKLLIAHRKKMILPEPVPFSDLIVSVDIYLSEKEGDIVANTCPSAEDIACIKKCSHIQTCGETEDSYLIPFNDKTFLLKKFHCKEIEFTTSTDVI